MSKLETILTQYRAAGEDERLALFVFHRHLRDQFRIIDRQDDMAWAEPGPVKSARSSLAKHWNNWQSIFGAVVDTARVRRLTPNKTTPKSHAQLR